MPARLDNSELSHAIVQTFSLLGRCTPYSEEMRRTQARYDKLLTEREARLPTAAPTGGPNE